MDAEQARDFLLGLPHVRETQQWGGLVYWVADKAIGGKMFCLVNPDGEHPPISYAAGQPRFAELAEIEGLFPAPYLARAFWIAAERWDVFRTAEWQAELQAAHQLTLAKLPRRTHAILAMSKAEQRRIVSERRKAIALKNAG